MVTLGVVRSNGQKFWGYGNLHRDRDGRRRIVVVTFDGISAVVSLVSDLLNWFL
jgi:hypothetical protein